MTPDLNRVINALLDAIIHDENDGGLLSRDTLRKASELRQVVEREITKGESTDSAFYEGFMAALLACSDQIESGKTADEYGIPSYQGYDDQDAFKEGGGYEATKARLARALKTEAGDDQRTD